MNRRTLLSSIGVSTLVVAWGAWNSRLVNAACSVFGRTPAQTEGPYYKRNPPLRTSLVEAGIPGRPLTIAGRVIDSQCRPMANTRVDVWHADTEGAYDSQGYRLRGYQVTDSEGRYEVKTIQPGLYPGRTRHIHVKITPPGRGTLTTQLYFPNEPGNVRDDIFNARLVIGISETPQGSRGEYDFVMDS